MTEAGALAGVGQGRLDEGAGRALPPHASASESPRARRGYLVAFPAMRLAGPRAGGQAIGAGNGASRWGYSQAVRKGGGTWGSERRGLDLKPFLMSRLCHCDCLSRCAGLALLARLESDTALRNRLR